MAKQYKDRWGHPSSKQLPVHKDQEWLDRRAAALRYEAEGTDQWWWLSFSEEQRNIHLGCAVMYGKDMDELLGRAWDLGINPGGEVWMQPIPPESFEACVKPAMTNVLLKAAKAINLRDELNKAWLISCMRHPVFGAIKHLCPRDAELIVTRGARRALQALESKIPLLRFWLEESEKRAEELRVMLDRIEHGGLPPAWFQKKLKKTKWSAAKTPEDWAAWRKAEAKRMKTGMKPAWMLIRDAHYKAIGD